MIYFTQANPVLLSVVFVVENLCLWRGEGQEEKNDVDNNDAQNP